MNIVHLVDHRHWRLKLDRYRFKVMDLLGAERTGNGWPGYERDLSVTVNLTRLYGRLPEVLVGYKPQEHAGFGDAACLRVLTFNEMYRRERVVPELQQAKPHVVLAHHWNDYEAYRVEFPAIRFVYAPHCTDLQLFHDARSLRDIDVMLVGRLAPQVYPVRETMRKAILELSSSFRCRILAHPGFELPQACDEGHLKEFAGYLNRARVCLTCSSKYRYRLSKYVEIPACGATMVADLPSIPQDDALHEASVVVSSTCSVQEVMTAVHDALSRDGAECRQRGVAYAARYGLESYVACFRKAVWGD